VENHEKRKKVSEIGQRVREARRRLGFRSQAEFGAALGGFTVQQISRAERGMNAPTPEILAALARHRVNVNWLLTGDGPILIDEPAAAPPRPTGIAADVDAIIRLMETVGDRPQATRRILEILAETAKGKTDDTSDRDAAPEP